MTGLPNESNLYFTSDLGIAVYLFTIGHKLVKTTLKGHNRLIFYFHKEQDTEAQVNKYLNGSGKAPARRLFENYRGLRALAFEQTNNLK